MIIVSKYTFRYWFEWGCREDFCPCLWSVDNVTKDKYNYYVDINELPISKELISFLCQLSIEHDNALDWNYPPDSLLWTKEEEEMFYIKAKEGYRRLQEELGSDYKIIYCEKK